MGIYWPWSIYLHCFVLGEDSHIVGWGPGGIRNNIGVGCCACMTLFLANFSSMFRVVWSWYYTKMTTCTYVHALLYSFPSPLRLSTPSFPLSLLLTCYSSSLPSLYLPPLMIPTLLSYLATFSRYSTMASSSRLQERTGRMPKSPSLLPSRASEALHLHCLHESSALRGLHHVSCLVWHYQRALVVIMKFNLMNTIRPSKTAMVKMNLELFVAINLQIFVQHPRDVLPFLLLPPLLCWTLRLLR